MKLTKLLIAAAIVASFGANAGMGTPATQQSNAVHAGAVSTNMTASMNDSIHNATSTHVSGAAVSTNMTASVNTAPQHVSALTAHEDKAAEAQMQAAQDAADRANYGVKGNPNLISQVQQPAAKPETPEVEVNIPGPFNTRGGHNDHNNSSHGEHGTGNGGNNAANSNSAHGLGGGSNIGGGRTGGGFHY